jgi:hypothetical protein
MARKVNSTRLTHPKKMFNFDRFKLTLPILRKAAMHHVYEIPIY